MWRLSCGTIAAVLVFVSAAWGHGATSPSCAPAMEASNIRLIRVEKNGVLVLEDGRAAHLEGILLPAGARERAPQFLADQAIAALANLAVGRHVALAAGRPKEDRYGRLRAQIFLPGKSGEYWLQTAILRRGLARVSISPDRRECADELYAAEDEARRRRSGIWAQAAYGVRTPAQLGRDIGTFQIVEGKIVSANVSGGRAYLDFGPDWHKDFTVVISTADLRNFRETGVDPRSYAGKTVRVRGWIERMGRPEMEVAIPEAIEVTDAGPLRGTLPLAGSAR